MSSQKTSPTFYLAIFAALFIPIGITLCWVDGSVSPPEPQPTSGTPFGYTISLLMFGVPAAIFAFFLRKSRKDIEWKAIFIATTTFSVLGVGLDIIFGPSFFIFPNKEATIGLMLPGYVFGEGWQLYFPIEEVGFYVLGNIFSLFCYLFANQWLDSGRSQKAYQSAAEKNRKWSADWLLVLCVAGLAVAAILFKNVTDNSDDFAIPGYFLFQLAVLALPTALLLRRVSHVVNWNSLAVSTFAMLLVSVVWEVSLGLPYGWWGFREEQMLGLSIRAWDNVPIEEPILWFAAPWMTVMVYEASLVYREEIAKLLGHAKGTAQGVEDSSVLTKSPKK